MTSSLTPGSIQSPCRITWFLCSGAVRLSGSGLVIMPRQSRVSPVICRRGKQSSRHCLTTAWQLPPNFRARTGLSKAQVAGALHVLKKRGKVVLTEYGKYALLGTAAAHVYAKDAIDRAMASG